MQFVAIDVETGSRSGRRVCQVGAVRVLDGEVVERFTTLVRPVDVQAGPGATPLEDFFDDFCIKLHHIRPVDVADAPTFAETWPALRAFIGRDELVAHNTQFDMPVLFAECRAAGLPVGLSRYGCTRRLSERMLRLPAYKLPFVAEALNVPFEQDQYHGAVYDAEICGAIMARLAAHGAHTSVANAMEAHGLRAGLLSDRSAGSVFVPASTSFALIKDIDTTPNPEADPRHPLYGKKVLFTGELQTMERKQAWEACTRVGATPINHVNRSIDYLVVGTIDGRRIGLNDRATSKFKDIEAARSKGGHAVVLDEEDFLNLLDANPDVE